jgi:hypothetical protein
MIKPEVQAPTKNMPKLYAGINIGLERGHLSKNGDYKTTLTKAEDEIGLLHANLRRTEGHGYA